MRIFLLTSSLPDDGMSYKTVLEKDLLPSLHNRIEGNNLLKIGESTTAKFKTNF